MTTNYKAAARNRRRAEGCASYQKVVRALDAVNGTLQLRLSTTANRTITDDGIWRKAAADPAAIAPDFVRSQYRKKGKTADLSRFYKFKADDSCLEFRDICIMLYRARNGASMFKAEGSIGAALTYTGETLPGAWA